MKARAPKPLTKESQQAVEFLSRVSEQLKLQHRHFDDAVVSRSIRLAREYAEACIREAAAAGPASVESKESAP
jgi:ubiquinone/menaquinone biosynthesis C-methylase UbiE